MPHKDIKLVPYESTMYDLLMDSLRGKYFQSKLNPRSIIQFPEKESVYCVENNRLSVWFPLNQKRGDLDLEEFSRYVLISKEQFEKYLSTNQDLENVVIAHKNAPIFNKSNSNSNSQAP